MNRTKTPQELLAQVRTHYQELSSFFMRLQHQNSSGLYPGAYTQEFQWQRGGRFELRTTSPQNKVLHEDLSPAGGPRAVPDFFADGAQVISVLPSGKRGTDQERPRPNSIPGWEVCGGPIVGWLQDTPTGHFFLSPPPGMTLTWSFGPRTVWHSLKVRELHITGRDYTDRFSLFLNPSATMLIGTEAGSADREPGYTLFLDQKENPQSPTTLGDAL